MHRLFLLRAYGDFVILLQALLESPQKNKYSLIASKHLEPLYQELSLVIDLSSIQIQFIDFGIANTQLSLFTNKYLQLQFIFYSFPHKFTFDYQC